MESVSHFFSEWSPQQLGFAVSAAIFLITTLLVSRKLIGFSITLLFLVFALVAGFIVLDQEGACHSIHSAISSSGENTALKQKFDDLQKSYDDLKGKLKNVREAPAHLEDDYPLPPPPAPTEN